MEYSGPGYLKLADIPDLETTTLQFNLDTSNKDILTNIKGYGGHSKGPKKVTASWDDAIPKSPLVAVDWVKVAALQGEVNISFVIRGVEYPCVGDIRTAGWQTGADRANSGPATFHGRLVE